MSFLARLFGRPARPRGRHAAAPGGAPAHRDPSAVPQPLPRVSMPPAGSSGSVVALVYRDGTSLAFPAGDPRARAFRTLADHLAARG